MLGIPNMIARLLQQETAEWLDYGASKSFPLKYGFGEKRNAISHCCSTAKCE